MFNLNNKYDKDINDSNFEWLEKPLLHDQTSDDKYGKKPTTVFKGFLIIYFWSFWSSLDNWVEMSDGDKPNPKNLTHKIDCGRVLDSIFSPYKSQTFELSSQSTFAWLWHPWSRVVACRRSISRWKSRWYFVILTHAHSPTPRSFTFLPVRIAIFTSKSQSFPQHFSHICIFTLCQIITQISRRNQYISTSCFR